jgi:predicted nucleotidyltransferase
MRQGDSYPAAVWEIVRQRYGNKVAGMMHDPNNLLAIEYMKAMRRQEVGFSVFTIPRRCVMHDSPEPQSRFASASFIRKSVAEADNSYLDYIPPITARLLSDRMAQGRTASMRQLERTVLYRMRTISESELMALPDMNVSLQNRFYAARNACSLDELFSAVKTKCYTMSRIRRIVMSAIIGIRREDLLFNPPYARVLAFNERGRELLGLAKQKSSIPVGTSLAKLGGTSRLAESFMALEERASQVYGLAQGEIFSAEQDFRAKIVMEETK